MKKMIYFIFILIIYSCNTEIPQVININYNNDNNKILVPDSFNLHHLTNEQIKLYTPVYDSLAYEDKELWPIGYNGMILSCRREIVIFEGKKEVLFDKMNLKPNGNNIDKFKFNLSRGTYFVDYRLVDIIIGDKYNKIYADCIILKRDIEIK